MISYRERERLVEAFEVIFDTLDKIAENKDNDNATQQRASMAYMSVKTAQLWAREVLGTEHGTDGTLA